MAQLLHNLIRYSAKNMPDAEALCFKDTVLSYAELWKAVDHAANGLSQLGVSNNQRIAIYLPKQPEAVISFFASCAAGGVFVPINPILKPEQVAYILRDCDVKILVTSSTRASLLNEDLNQCPALTHLVLIDAESSDSSLETLSFNQLSQKKSRLESHRIDADMAAILYTSGSTGQPKGVVLSHANMVAGAESVCEYLQNSTQDKILAVLPFSFDYGLSQLTTAFNVGASVVLIDYLLPRDVIRAVCKYHITGLAAVPPLWNQLALLEWPEEAKNSLRYLTNSGGAMPLNTTASLQQALPDTDIYLMYGLTEAFRSTYLDPEEIKYRPDSMGKAIPNAEVMVVRPDGSECGIDEPGELVHRGALVSLGYWNDQEKTNKHFKPAPGQPAGLALTEIAVWSGDKVRRDAEGFHYFISRNDEMIKTSGYRVSPGEIEETVLALDTVLQAIAFAAPHPMIGQGIVLLAQANCEAEHILTHCRAHLPMYMLPGRIEILDDLPRNTNGKIDRKALLEQYQDSFIASGKL